jgi:glucuronate isomerase
MLTLALCLHYDSTRGGLHVLLDDDRLFDAEPKARHVAKELYNEIKGLPLISPHGHTEPRWYAENLPFPDPAQLLIVPDHYIFRMLFSQGIRLEDLGVPTADGSAVEMDGRKIINRSGKATHKQIHTHFHTLIPHYSKQLT